MWMLLVTVIIVGATAYVWCTRGFFSAFIHMICVFAAGAIAFGVWEPLSELIREGAPDRGTFSFLSGAALTLGLALPFAISLAVLRAVIDKILPANAQCEKVADYVGGGVCGVISGIISAGIVVLSVGFLRADPEFLGYAQASYTSGQGRGSIEKNAGTMVPWVDRIVAGLYSQLSTTTLRTDEPLAKLYPDLATFPGELRVTFDGKSRNSITRKDLTFRGWYAVGDPTKGVPVKSLLSDAWSENTQKISDLSGEQITSGNYYLAGFVVKFKTSAREKTGTVFVGNAQVRLVVANRDDEEDTKALHPIAMIGRTDSAIRVDYARFRYDSDNLFISSVGAEAEPVMAFEFPVPAGYDPIAFFVKGVRYPIEGKAANTFASVADRDEKIQAGEFVDMGGVGPILDDKGNPLKAQEGASTIMAQPVTVANSIGVTLQKGTEGPRLTLAQDNRGWAVQDGKTTIATAQANKAGLEKPLRIDHFALNADTALIKVVVSPTARPDDFNKKYEAIDPSALPVLVDTNGTTYQAVGYIYKDSTKFELQFQQSNPLKNIGEAPRVTRNTPDKQLTLIFVVNNGIDLKEFRIGDTVLDDWSAKPMHVDMPFRR